MLGKILRRGLLALTLLLLGGCTQTAPPQITLAPAIQVLRQEVSSPRMDLRADVMQSVEHLHGFAAMKIIAQGLIDPSPAVRFTAAMVVGKKRLAGFKPQLQKMLLDPDKSVRLGAIYALARLGDTQPLADLPAALDDNSPVVRGNAAMVLGDLGDVRAVRLLRKHTDDPNDAVRFDVTCALAQLGDSHAIDSLIGLSLSAYMADHVHALSVCQTLRNPLAVNVLIAGLNDPVPAARLIAARGLGRRGSTRGETVALHYAQSSHADLRALAALALGSIAVSDNADVLNPMLHDPHPEVRIAAAAGLIDLHHWAVLARHPQ